MTELGPQTPLEETLHAIWAEVLGVVTVGRNDNFFARGGDSMLALRLVAACHAVGIGVTLRDLFQNPQLSAFAAAAAATGPAGQPPVAAHGDQLPGNVPPGVEMLFPASQMQCGVLFESERRQDVNAYHVVAATRLRNLGEIQYQEVQDALRRIAGENIVLRLRFDFTSYEFPVQVVRRTAVVPLAYEDLAELDEKKRSQRVDAKLSQERASPFDRDDYPLWRVTFFKVSRGEALVILAYHHAIMDGWSLARFFDKFEAALQGRLYPAAPSGVNERAIRLETAALESAETTEFWRSRVGSWRPLPVRERSRGPGDPPLFSAQSAIDDEIRKGVRQAAAEWGCSPKHVYLAVHLRVLAEFARWHDYAATTFVVNARPEESEADNALGMFLNVVPLSVESLGSSWAELARELLAAEAELQRHRWFPLATMVARLGMPQPTVWFNYTDFSKTAMREYLQGVTETNVTELPLTVSIVDDGLIVAGLSDHFSAADCEQLLDMHMADLSAAVRAGVRKPSPRLTGERGAPLESLSLCRGEQREQSPFLIPDAVARRAAESPGALAVVGAGERLTYAELLRRADRVAGALLADGVRPGELVGVCLDRGPSLVAALLGVLRAGCAYVPLDPEYPAARLEFMLADSGASAVVGSAALAIEVPAGVRPVEVADALRAGRPLPAERPAVSAGDLAYVIYTSGSTGVPKGVAVEHGGVMNIFDIVVRDLAVSSNSVVAALTTPTFDIAAVELLMPLTAGARVAIAAAMEKHPEQAGKFLESSGATIAQATPSMWAVLAAGGWSPVRPMTILSGGEQLPEPLAAYYLRQGARVFNGYGPTEASIYASMARMELGKPVTIGRPGQNLAFAVLDGERRVVPAGEQGELWIGGAGVARGYVNRPELTAERFVAGLVPACGEMRWYRTGDLARQLPGGEFQYFGRIDRQVKLRGFRIELGEIEGVLAGHPAVSAVAVELREGADPADSHLVAYLVVRDPPGLTVQEVRSWLGARLPGHLVPASFAVMGELPLMSNGKVDRAALRGMEGSPLPRLGPAPGPRTPLEETLHAVWAEVLGVATVGRDDNFFTQGGDSLLALRLVARLSEAIGTRVGVTALYRNPTPSQLAGSLSSEQSRD